MIVNAKAIRKPLQDIIYSMAALVLYNGVIQFAIYPFLNNHMDQATFGVVLSLHSILIIVAGACGTAANNSRMVTQLTYAPTNGDYNFILIFLGVASVILGTVYFAIAGTSTITPLSISLYAVLMFFMLLRHYGDVEFRLSIDFIRYLVYYCLVSVGYCLGLYIYQKTGQWMLVLLVGEILAVGYVVWRGHIFSPPVLKRTRYTFAVWKSVFFLLVANFITLLIVNADRILLLFFEGGAAVATYYVASLLGKLVALLTGPLSGVMLSYLVRYDGLLTCRMFLQSIVFILILSSVVFGCCLALSSWFIFLLYPSLLESSKSILSLAIAGQIIYFAASVLKTVLLRFYEEKYQTYLNLIYGTGFFGITILALVFGGLNEFAWAVLIANIAYFLLLGVFGVYKIDKKYGSSD